MGTPLTASTWQNLLKLTAENLSNEQLGFLLRDVLGGIQTLDQLTQEQAEEVLRALGPLPKLKEILWQSSVDAIEGEQAKMIKPLSKVEAIAITEAIVPVQLDALAAMLLDRIDKTLFNKPVEL